MGFQITSQDYAEYLKRAYKKIHENGDYITELDLATGDGDHWSNLDMGFGRLNDEAERLASMELDSQLREIGKIMMSVIGGSSGVLYGSAYLAAGKAVKGVKSLGREELGTVLEAMLTAIMERGKAQEGFKTMIDCLAPAVRTYRSCLEEQAGDQELCRCVKEAAQQGAEATSKMEAVKGRASYQADKGVGHLDPGAVTMSYQIETLMDYVAEKAI